MPAALQSGVISETLLQLLEPEGDALAFMAVKSAARFGTSNEVNGASCSVGSAEVSVAGG